MLQSMFILYLIVLKVPTLSQLSRGTFSKQGSTNKTMGKKSNSFQPVAVVTFSLATNPPNDWRQMQK